MALNDEYFDSIQIDLVKRKYYNANKVNAVFADIREQARFLMHENEDLRRQLEQKNSSENSLFPVQKLYREVLARADMRADEIVKKAEEDGRKILQNAEGQHAQLILTASECLSAVREREMQNLEFLDAQIQRMQNEENGEQVFFSGFKSQNADEGKQESLYSDLEKKISSLAQEINKLESD